MPYYLLNHKLEIIATSEISTFNISGFMVVKADTPDLLPKKRKEHTKIPEIIKNEFWDFSVLSKVVKEQILLLYRENNFPALKELINKYKIAVLCCSEHKKLISLQIEKAKTDGVL